MFHVEHFSDVMRDVVVIGGGHAGIEAAWVTANQGHDVVMVTLQANRIGAMSCNPAIGGQGKGQLVKELDILGGLMPRVADETGLQFRKLNTKKGPAVWSSRAQSDKERYSEVMTREMKSHPRIQVLEAEVCDVSLSGMGYRILLTNGDSIHSKTVILTVGTFLNGIMHVGESKSEGGRHGDYAAKHLSQSMERNFGIQWRRFKTGTPPRLAQESIHWDTLQSQEGDLHPSPFSLWGPPIQNKVCCYITYTTPEIHQIIKDNIVRAPLYNGQITSLGPRYCPSIEDKVMRFEGRPRHQLFLEPESLQTNVVYVNGLSTSLPADVQEKIVHNVAGLEDAKFLRYGYAVEYDCIDPRVLRHSLEHRAYPGLFFAGQINGSSGYEEAAAQGFVAGLGVSCRIREQASPIFNRAESYTGVLIDDLIHKGAEEPYRMFTSRCEYRLAVREDNCVERLLGVSKQYGLLPPEKIHFCEHMLAEKERLKREVAPTLHVDTTEGPRPLEQAIRMGALDMGDMSSIFKATSEHPLKGGILENLFVEYKYKGYLEKERRAFQRVTRSLHKKIPVTIDFMRVFGLSNEAKTKLSQAKPGTLEEATGLYGVTPADILVLLRYLEKDYADVGQNSDVSPSA